MIPIILYFILLHNIIIVIIHYPFPFQMPPYAPGQLYIQPLEQTSIKVIQGTVHINGVFLPPNIGTIIQPGMLTQVTILQQSDILLIPEPQNKYITNHTDQNIPFLNKILNRLPTSKLQVILHINNTLLNPLSQLQFLQTNSLTPIFIDLSQQILQNAVYTTQFNFENQFKLYNPLVLPSFYEQKIIDIGLLKAQTMIQQLNDVVVVISASISSNKFNSMASNKQLITNYVNKIKNSSIDCDISIFTDFEYLSQSTNEIGLNIVPEFLNHEITESIQQKFFRFYFYGDGEFLTPKSRFVSREKIEFLTIQNGIFVQNLDSCEYKYGLVMTKEEEFIGLVKIQKIDEEMVQMVVFNEEIVSYEELKIVVGNVDVV